MRTTSEDDREHGNGRVEDAPGAAPTGTRRAVLGLTAGGLAQATRGLLLPAWLADEVSAAEGQVAVQHRANRRRHRRIHRHAHDHPLAVLAVSQPKVIPSGQRTPIRFDLVMAIQEFSTQDNSLIFPNRSGLYRLELFLTWTWNGSGVGVCDTGIRVVSTAGEHESTTRAVLSRPITTVSFSQVLRLDKGDLVQVIGQVTHEQDSGAPVDVSAGTVVVQSMDQ